MKYNHVFKPIVIRGLELRNRVIFPAMATNMIDEGGFVTDQLIHYHAARAFGGTGLNITEAASVHSPSAPKNFLSIHDDQFLPGLTKLADTIHKAGGKACVQLWQGGAVAAGSDPNAICIMPSETPLGKTVVPGATIGMIQEVVQSFGEAAKRAVIAGFHCVEFHAAHGYSPHAFLSPAMNKRTDQYGGSLENRARYALECIEEIRRNIPEDMPLLMRIVPFDDYVDNGLTMEEMIEFCKMAQKAGVDVLDVSRGNAWSAAVKYEVPPIDLPKGFNVENAAKLKKETGMLTIAVGRINDPQQAEVILANEQADMVAIGRAQLADPEFCYKAKVEDEERIISCVGCNQGCVDRYSSPEQHALSCIRNPSLGREKEYILVKTKKSKKILVVGGGMAGIEASIILKQRGHHPILCEASDQLGGQFILAGAAPRKGEMRDAAILRGKQAEIEGVEIHLSTPVTAALIEEIDPQTVIVATGAEPIELNIPGANLPNVTNSFDVLGGKITPRGRIVVIGGGIVGLEVAEFLAMQNNHVTIVEAMNEVGRELGNFRKICVMESFYHLKINTITSAQCLEIKEESLTIAKDGKLEDIECDYVVVAIGSKPRDYEEIKLYCVTNEIPHYIIGDALLARRASDAIEEAAKIARLI
ncbi:FAD-dependent oxidoreductase [Bacillus sp. B15-48]|uniref:bile acid Fe-S flavoenzyme BaiCD n=1 Tax=Bacillus sp. B15-48 TaxID=1548601 RepID=UPI00193FC466|nr:FAD-dependent oxidoreductase [Bacillus sp. B15-48]MBM4762961.1 NADH oxidase [Bacillus sp. B15-48]